MSTIQSLTPEIHDKIFSYATNDTKSLLSLGLVNKEWQSIVSEASESWIILCQIRFPGSSAQSRIDYKFLLSTRVQSAARIIQRFLCKIDCDKATWWRRPLDVPLSPFSIVPCCVCGVRFDLRMLNTCWIGTCRRKFSICGCCEAKCPEWGMGRAVGVRARVPACFGCKEKGSICDREERGKLMLEVFTAQ
jgi:hypothetical protein